MCAWRAPRPEVHRASRTSCWRMPRWAVQLGWQGRAPGRGFLSAPTPTAGSLLTSLLSLPPSPPAQWEMDDTAEYVSSLQAILLPLLCTLHACGPQSHHLCPCVPSVASDGLRVRKDSCQPATPEWSEVALEQGEFALWPQARHCLSLCCSGSDRRHGLCTKSRVATNLARALQGSLSCPKGRPSFFPACVPVSSPTPVLLRI